MFIRWSRHAKERFAERAIKLGINYGELEFEIKQQKVKWKIENEKVKTVFKIQESLMTAVKKETEEFIHVITLWEADELEAKEWKIKMK